MSKINPEDRKKPCFSQTARYEIIGGAVLFVIIIIALLVFFLNDSENTKELPEPEAVDTFEDLKVIIESGDVTACDSLNGAERMMCIDSIQGIKHENNLSAEIKIIEEVSQTGDASQCEQFADVVLRKACEVAAKTDVGIGEQDVEFLMTKAFETGDQSYCYEIENPVERDFCLEQIL